MKNLTNASIKHNHINLEGIISELNGETVIVMPKKAFNNHEVKPIHIPFDELKNKFATGEITIEGFEHTSDGNEILGLIIDNHILSNKLSGIETAQATEAERKRKSKSVAAALEMEMEMEGEEKMAKGGKVKNSQWGVYNYGSLIDTFSDELTADTYANTFTPKATVKEIKKGSEGRYEGGGKISESRIDEVLRHYVIAALWSTPNMDNEDEMLDDKYSFDDIDTKTLESMRNDIKKFIKENSDAIDESGTSDEQLGHDIWLTRNHHGSGFFDRGYEPEIEKKLEFSAYALKETNLYVGDDGKIHAMGVYAKGGLLSKLKGHIATAHEKTKSVIEQGKKAYKKTEKHRKLAIKHAKTAQAKGKELYGKAEAKVKQKIHDEKKKIALNVIDATKDKVSTPSEKMALKAAENIVDIKFEKGGKIEKVLNEFKQGTLKTSSGNKVKTIKQALAIGYSEARAAGEKVPKRKYTKRKK